MPETLVPDPQTLLVHADWVRALARRLVGDQAEADDLAQDAWVAALRSPPVTALNLRGWLARVVRNAFLQNRRSSVRRHLREAAAAPAEAQPSAADLVERAAAHRELVTCVLALGEPYRTTVLLRWFEGLAPRQVAQRMAVPVATVRTRLHRAHAELRVALTRERQGEARAWMALLLPVPGWLKPATVAGGVVLVKKVPLLLAASLVAAATVAFWPGLSTPADRSAGRPDAAPQAAHDPGGSSGTTLARPDPVTTQRQRVADPTVAAAPAAPSLTVRGRALREDGTSAVGVAVGWSEPPGSEQQPLAVSDGEGRFGFTVPAQNGELIAVETRWATLLAGVVSGTAATIEPVVVVAPAIGLAGVVVDPEGGPIADAIVGVPLPENLRARLRVVLDWSVDNTMRATTDARGRFALPRVAQTAESRLLARREGFLARELPLPAATDLQLRIVLERPRLQEGALRGQVVTPDGAPVAGARVALGTASMRTQADGVFELPRGKDGTADRVLAVKAGWLPVSRQLERDPARPAEFVILRLSGTPLSIHGRVVDEAGAPQAGMKVWVNDPTVFGLLDDRPAAVENIIAGLKERVDIERLLATLPKGEDPGKLINNTPTVMFGFVLSDADGRFELTGLTDRDYTLVAMDTATLLRTQAGPVRAGSRDVQLVLAASQCFARVAGQLVSRTGAPVAGVRMVAMTDTIRLAMANRGSTMHAQGVAHAITDAEGKFELLRVPKAAVYLRMDGERILPLEYGRGVPGGIEALSKRPVDDLRIVVGQRVHLRVELEDLALADEAEVLDDQGKVLMVNVFEGKSRNTTQRAGFRDGKTSVLAVPDAATTLVLYQAGKEVRRSPLSLAVGDLNVVRL